MSLNILVCRLNRCVAAMTLAVGISAAGTSAKADSGDSNWFSQAFTPPAPARSKGRSTASTAAESSAFWSGSTSSGETGVASYYWQPQRVATGGWFNPNAMTAAHKTLPFGTRVRVTHLASGRSVTVVINDRGPFVRGRIIDLSRAAAQSIGMAGSGVASVRVERI